VSTGLGPACKTGPFAPGAEADQVLSEPLLFDVDFFPVSRNSIQNLMKDGKV
jgi:hypothetical protein